MNDMNDMNDMINSIPSSIDKYIEYVSENRNQYLIPKKSIVNIIKYIPIEMKHDELYILPEPENTDYKHFNSSIIVYDKIKQGWSMTFNSKYPDNYRYFICYRYQDKNESKCSELWIYELENLISYKIINNYCLLKSDTDKLEYYEDPRFFIYNNNIYLSYVYWMNNNNITYIDWKTTDICIYQKNIILNFDENNIKLYCDKKDEKTPPFGNNLLTKNGKEKNWIYFEYNNELYILYSIIPFILLKYNIHDNTCSTVIHKTILSNIIIRNSTPIFFDHKLKKFIMYLHCTDYNIFECIFDIINLKININYEPVFSSVYIYNNVVKNGILFPCGLIYDEYTDNDILSLGVNDLKLGILTHKHITDKFYC